MNTLDSLVLHELEKLKEIYIETIDKPFKDERQFYKWCSSYCIDVGICRYFSNCLTLKRNLIKLLDEASNKSPHILHYKDILTCYRNNNTVPYMKNVCLEPRIDLINKLIDHIEKKKQATLSK